MIYNFKTNININFINRKNNVIATTFNGAIYIENNVLHIVNSKIHYIYKFDNTIGWYLRNNKTNVDCYLGKGASPTMNFEKLDIKNAEIFEDILLFSDDYEEIQKIKNKIEMAKIEHWFVEYDRICNEHSRCQRLGIECHHNIEQWDVQAVENAERLKSLRNSEN